MLSEHISRMLRRLAQVEVRSQILLFQSRWEKGESLTMAQVVRHNGLGKGSLLLTSSIESSLQLQPFKTERGLELLPKLEMGSRVLSLPGLNEGLDLKGRSSRSLTWKQAYLLPSPILRQSESSIQTGNGVGLTGDCDSMDAWAASEPSQNKAKTRANRPWLAFVEKLDFRKETIVWRIILDSSFSRKFRRNILETLTTTRNDSLLPRSRRQLFASPPKKWDL